MTTDLATVKGALAPVVAAVGDATPSEQASVAPLLIDLAESIRPGARLVAAMRSLQPRLERSMTIEMAPAWHILGDHVAAVAASRSNLLREAASDNIDQIVAAAQLERWQRDVLGPIMQRQWGRVGEATIQKLSEFDISSAFRRAVEQNILQQGGTRAGLLDITTDTKDALLRAVDDGLRLGLNPRETARLMRDYVPSGRFTNAGPKYRSQLIARTETLNAQRFASLEMYQVSPNITQVVAFDGEEFDEECAARNGEIFTLEEAAAEAASTHPNCVLAFAPA